MKLIQKIILSAVFFGISLGAFAQSDLHAGKQHPIFKYWQSYGNALSEPGLNSFGLIFNGSTPYLAGSYNYNTIAINTLKKGVWSNAGIIYGAYAFSLATNPNPGGNLYVAYGAEASVSTGKVAVKAFNGKTWATVGKPVTYQGAVYSNSLTVSKQGTPYIFYSDASSYGHVSKFNNKTKKWIPVGNKIPLIGAGLAHLSIVVNAQGVPFIASFNENTDVVTVMKLKGNTWKQVGSTIESTPADTGPFTFVISPTGVPYLGCDSFDQKLQVFKLGSNNKWLPVGKVINPNPGWANLVLSESLVISSTGVPSISFHEGSPVGPLFVKTFNSDENKWVSVGNTNLGVSYASGLVLDSKNNPYLLYANMRFQKPLEIGVKTLK